MMAQTTSGVEWRITVGDGSPKDLVSEGGPVSRLWLGLKRLIEGLIVGVQKFLKKAWSLAVEDPRKVIHCLKVGLALSVVSIVYCARPLYEGVGGNAMWAIMTVVVVYEKTVGATICKCLNRSFGTFLAAFLGLGVHWLANRSAEKLEPFVIGVSVFLLASAATLSRLIPKVKEKFDYGAMIFILTFSLVAVSSYRVDRLLDMAHQRISTIGIGTSLCILVSMFICPIWAGQELYILITRNMDKLADSLDGCVAEYFNHNGVANGKQSEEKLLGYKSVLISKATEESLIKFAIWEPAHGPFNFKHPWKQYIKIGASLRNCAYCTEALNGCLDSENQASELIKKQLGNECLRLSSKASNVIRELANTVKTMQKSSSTEFLVEEMRRAVQELQHAMKFPYNSFVAPQLAQPEESKKLDTTAKASILEIIPGLTLASLLIEVAGRMEAIYDAVEELANLAEFKVADHDKSKQNQPNNRIVLVQSKNEKTMNTPQKSLSSLECDIIDGASWKIKAFEM